MSTFLFNLAGCANEGDSDRDIYHWIYIKGLVVLWQPCYLIHPMPSGLAVITEITVIVLFTVENKLPVGLVALWHPWDRYTNLLHQCPGSAVLTKVAVIGLFTTRYKLPEEENQ